MKRNFITIVVSIVLFVLSFYLLKDVSVVPIHWNLSGDVDKYGSKYWLGLFLLLPVAIAYLMDLLKKIDPRSENYNEMKKEYAIIKWFLVIFMYLIYVFMLLNIFVGLSIVISMNILLGTLFIVLGIYLKDVKQNYFLGIKTPWTLNNDDVWESTHKRSKIVFIIIGISFLVNVFLKSFIPFIILILGIVYIFYYSYKEYKKVS